MYCPEPNTPIPVGPSSLYAFLNCASITSKAFCQLTGSNFPFLSNSPLEFTRKRGCVSLSAPYIILALKYPLIQFKPRFTGAAGSPLTATICSSFVATIIPQPVPQNLQTDLSHFQPPSASFAAAKALLGNAIPTALAALAAAAVFKNSRLLYATKASLSF